MRELLPALDNLERALAAAEGQPNGGEHHLAEGIRLVQAELAAAMNRVGVEGYWPKGEQFDPNVHEAMAQQPSRVPRPARSSRSSSPATASATT